MTKKDVFANIATNQVSGRKELLHDASPKNFTKKYFKVDNTNEVVYEEKSYEENVEEFHNGIEQLKNKFVPFLHRYAPSLTNIKKKININSFSYQFENKKEETIAIPHYHGPVGRWTSTYTTKIKVNELNQSKKTYLVCKGIDYYASIYINDHHVMDHEGFFASFECDITAYAHQEMTLKIVVKNDIPTIGNSNMQENGDKLYAATGLGWDSAEDGWHHCPAGGGIFDQVYVEQRESVFIKDLFVKPDIDRKRALVMIHLYSHLEKSNQQKLTCKIIPYNFKDTYSKELSKEIEFAYGDNYYYFDIDLPAFKLWECEKPYMYNCQCAIGSSEYETTFGMRKFHMDEENEPKGTLYLNNKEILLRGANEMGHLQLCVIRNDFDQLIEDILIAKYCNMNCYRITQRPVQEEIYHYCDCLGMLNQVDLPLFGFMRKNKFYEGIKQAGEMERLVRNHPSVIVASYINEPFAPDKYNLSHRHLSRIELELFFDACDAAVYLENPDRVIKRVEGDYDPPTNKGLSDFHCYNMWYTNHAIPLGMLYKGYLPATKIGWKVGCGEYGAEGLDNYEVMRKYYPSEWLPKNDNDIWIPDQIIKSQTNTMHGDWYEEQDNIKDWIIESQRHQGFATKLMTEAFRRRSDLLIYTAIHLLIDAWPSGWMKTLLDVDRVPKTAYFDFKDSLQPLKASLRCDRWQAYEGDVIDVEAWVLNDTDKIYADVVIQASVRDQEKTYKSYQLDHIDIKGCDSECKGIIPVTIPSTDKDRELFIDVELLVDGNVVNVDRFTIETYPAIKETKEVYSIGKLAKSYVESSRYIEPCDYKEGCTVLISSVLQYEKDKKKLKNCHKIFLQPDEKIGEYKVDGSTFTYDYIFPEEVGENCDVKGLSFVACHKNEQDRYGKNGFSYWYNHNKQYIDHVATRYIKGELDQVIAFSFEKPSFGKVTSGMKKRLPVVGRYKTNTFISFELDGRLNYNPIVDRLLIDMIKKAEEK